MARSLNKVQLIGNLGADPEVRYFASGDAFTRFTLATSESWKDKSTGETKESTEWHRCFATRRLAEVIGQYLRKGGKIYVEGKLKTRSYDKEGVTHYATEIHVDDMMMLDGRQGGGSGAHPEEIHSPAPDHSPGATAGNDFSDIPF